MKPTYWSARKSVQPSTHLSSPIPGPKDSGFLSPSKD